MNLNQLFLNENDRVLIDDDKKNYRDEIKFLYTQKSFLSACDNCNGRDYTVPLVPVAEQTRKILKIPV